ncbi:MAG: TetR/AcrR family transcriptional regulator C-terminal ligand-binding domain-containing protein, partial [Cellulomonas sp.]|nr:TetR/AcrR family transcriptional regulator C-terminal ligand-binding domain-containing protein [Cellulomonas sp.]
MSLNDGTRRAQAERDDHAAVARRRRGQELDDALLDAAWAELSEKGYDRLTVEGVATRAATARAVVYRRWPTKPDLARAAVAHGATPPDDARAPDTGNLRSDLVELLRWQNESRAQLAVTLTVQLAGYYQETRTGPTGLRDLLATGQPTFADQIFDRAAARGEIDPDRLTPRVRDLPMALFRAELFMSL